MKQKENQGRSQKLSEGVFQEEKVDHVAISDLHKGSYLSVVRMNAWVLNIQITLLRVLLEIDSSDEAAAREGYKVKKGFGIYGSWL